MKNAQEIATFASGCFWCTEAVFQQLKGVLSVTSGYAGEGEREPSYEEVSSGESGFVEAIQVVFDPSLISFDELLHIFFKTHDSTSFDRQGADAGPQYRSVVFYHNEEQKLKVKNVIETFNKEQIFGKNVVTEVLKFSHFYKAEPYHQNFYNRNSDYPYCTVVINPKLEKLYRDFPAFLKAS